MKNFLIVIISLSLFSACGQSYESTYALNQGVTKKGIEKNNTDWGTLKDFPQASYVKIKLKPDDTFYINIAVGGKFAYGHYFKFLEIEGNEYKYQRIDGDKDEYLFINYSLDELAKSNQYDEKVQMKMINYRTNFGMFYKF